MKGKLVLLSVYLSLQACKPVGFCELTMAQARSKAQEALSANLPNGRYSEIVDCGYKEENKEWVCGYKMKGEFEKIGSGGLVYISGPDCQISIVEGQ